jgi:site-specific recombinase XerD
MTDVSAPPSPLVVACSAYIDHGRSIGWSERTVHNYRHHLGVALVFLARRGCVSPSDISPADLDALMAYVLEEGRAKRSRVQLAVLLKQVFGWWHAQGRIVVDPSLTLALPDDGEDDLLSPPLSEGEVRALFEALPRRSVCDLRNACLLELLYGCGLRIGEAIALDVGDLDLSRRVVTVIGGKHGQDRVVPIMGTAQAAAQDYLAVRRTLLKGPDHGALFLSQYGKRLVLGSVYRFFEGLNSQRGPDVRRLTPHLFRHSIAVHLKLVPGRLKEDYDKAMPGIAVGLSS